MFRTLSACVEYQHRDKTNPLPAARPSTPSGQVCRLHFLYAPCGQLRPPFPKTYTLKLGDREEEVTIIAVLDEEGGCGANSSGGQCIASVSVVQYVL